MVQCRKRDGDSTLSDVRRQPQSDTRATIQHGRFFTYIVPILYRYGRMGYGPNRIQHQVYQEVEAAAGEMLMRSGRSRGRSMPENQRTTTKDETQLLL